MQFNGWKYSTALFDSQHFFESCFIFLLKNEGIRKIIGTFCVPICMIDEFIENAVTKLILHMHTMLAAFQSVKSRWSCERNFHIFPHVKAFLACAFGGISLWVALPSFLDKTRRRDATPSPNLLEVNFVVNFRLTRIYY